MIPENKNTRLVSAPDSKCNQKGEFWRKLVVRLVFQNSIVEEKNRKWSQKDQESNQEWGLNGIKWCPGKSTDDVMAHCNPLSVAPAVSSSPTARVLDAHVRGPALVHCICGTLTQAAETELWDCLYSHKKGKNYWNCWFTIARRARIQERKHQPRKIKS